MAFSPDRYVETDYELGDRLYVDTFISKGERGFIGGTDMETGNPFGYEIAIDPAAIAGKTGKEQRAAVHALLAERNADGSFAATVQAEMTILPDHEIYKRLSEMAAAPPDMGAHFAAAAEPPKVERRAPGMTMVHLGKLGG